MTKGTAIYRLLGISPSASTDSIKKAFRSKAHETHPDQNPDNPKAAELFVQVKKAYDLLSDESKRKEWHERHSNLPWLWKPKAKPKPKPGPGTPHPDLNWCCAACGGVVSIRCMVCKVGLCPHFAIMVTMDGYEPKPVCVECKRVHNERKHSGWKLMQMIRDRGL